MIGSRVLHAQTELKSHHRWLSSFISRTRSYPVSSRGFFQVVHTRDNGRYRHLARGNNVPKQVWTASFATKRLKIKRPGKASEHNDRNVAVLKELRQAVDDVQIKRVASLYSSLNDKKLVKANDFRIIAQCLHYSLRVAKRLTDAQKRRAETEELVAFAETLVKDLGGGKILPHCQAHVHLLGFFKESGVRDDGVRFWQWLVVQDDLHVNPDVYGAAIELLAVSGKSLQEMEDLYIQALDRFPGNFSAYHLSPEAIVPDRDQPTTLKGVPISLLQGILTARLLHGNARNAYLALDTALRLYPDQVPARFFQLFLEERPLLEAYTVFAIACRGGIVIPSNQFRQLLGALRNSSELSSPVNHAIAVRAMLSTLYLYIGAGGQVTQNVLNEIIISITQFLRLKGVADLTSKQKQKIGLDVMDIVRSLLLVFARYGVKPGLTAFNSIITNLGGFGHSKEIVGIALADIKGLGLQPNEVTRRSILTAAGTLGDGEFVLKAWDGLVQARTESEQSPDATDFFVLIKNATATEQRDFARLQFEEWKEKIPSKDHDNIMTALDEYSNERQLDQASEALDTSLLLKEIKKVSADLGIILDRTHQTPRVQDFREQRLPITLLQTSSELSLPAKVMRGLYDELTAEPTPSQSVHSTTEQYSDISNSGRSDLGPTTEQLEPNADGVNSTFANSGPSPAVSPTNIPFGILRYQNWKTINRLMELANVSDELYFKAVDAAIAAGVAPPQRTLGLSLETTGDIESYGLSDVVKSEQITKPATKNLEPVKIQEKRDMILRLRGRHS